MLKTNNADQGNNLFSSASVEDILTKLQNNNNIGSAQILQTAMNLLMLAERNLHLENTTENKANGFFERQLGTSLGTINLKVPRDRNGDFRPAILQHHINEMLKRGSK